MFDSDFDSNDMSISDYPDTDSNDIEFLDTSDVQEEADSISEQQNDDLSDREGYSATVMTEEQQQKIDSLWNSGQHYDIEPYQATRLSEEQMNQIDEIWEEKNTGDIPVPYKATSIDSTDDVSPAMYGDFDIEFGFPSLEEEFAAEVDALSLEDLNKEHERLASLSGMNDLDIFAEFDNTQNSEYDSELFNTLIDGLPKETLERLRDGLATGDPDTYEYFGINGDDGSNDSNASHTLSRKR